MKKGEVEAVDILDLELCSTFVDAMHMIINHQLYPFFDGQDPLKPCFHPAGRASDRVGHHFVHDDLELRPLHFEHLAVSLDAEPGREHFGAQPVVADDVAVICHEVTKEPATGLEPARDVADCGALVGFGKVEEGVECDDGREGGGEERKGSHVLVEEG